MTALHLASKHGQLEVMQLLLASGAAVDAATARGTTPFQLAARKASWTLVCCCWRLARRWI